MFEYINTIAEGEYTSSLNGIEYYLDLSSRDTTLPQINISFNDIRNCFKEASDRSFEKEGESIVYNRFNGNLYYNRIKEHIPSILVPNYKIAMDIEPRTFTSPFPKPISKLLDQTYQLFQAAEKI